MMIVGGAASSMSRVLRTDIPGEHWCIVLHAYTEREIPMAFLVGFWFSGRALGFIVISEGGSIASGKVVVVFVYTHTGSS
jgi:hypothetical protein